MIVTDKKYYMDNVYLSKLDLMVKRMEGTDDNILPIDGDEGQGKTEFAVGTCYYIAYQTGRKYDVNNIFFDLEAGIKFAASTKEQIIHFDEGALGLLTTQWWNKTQQKFLQLVMIARKKKHFIVICIPKFYKLNQYIIEDRSIGLVHIYSRKNLKKGRFCYYTKNAKERLYQDWKRKRIKNYRKYYVFRGSFVQAMKKVFTKEQLDDYERKKDKAIMSLLKVDDNKKKEVTAIDVKAQMLNDLRRTFPEITLDKWAVAFGLTRRTLERYSAKNKKDTEDSTRKNSSDTEIPTTNII